MTPPGPLPANSPRAPETPRPQRVHPLLAWLPWLAAPVAAWARHVQRRHTHASRSLNPAECALARAVGVAAPEDIQLVVCPRLPFPLAGLLDWLAGKVGLPGPGATLGLTLGSTIFLQQDVAQSATLLAHECRHVHQFEQAGSLDAFMRQYLHEVAAHGYHAAPMEVDARHHATLATLATRQPPTR